MTLKFLRSALLFSFLLINTPYFTSIVFSEEPKVINSIPNYSIEPRRQDVKSFPCSECHQSFQSKEQTKDLRFPHAGLQLKHMLEVKKCDFCHSKKNSNMLHLLDGVLISYDESYKICSQCHGKIATNWKKGLHGKIGGQWDGERLHFNCTLCHNAHDPKFKPMEAVAPPSHPKFLLEKEEHE